MINLTTKEKLKNLPRVYVESFVKNELRREVIRSDFYNLGIDNYSFFITTPEQDAKKVISGCDGMFDREGKHKLLLTSYLEAIKHWYENTNEEYAIFVEDDVWFESVRYWNFTWDDFVRNLPPEWDCIHLGTINMMHPSWDYRQLDNTMTKCHHSEPWLMFLIRRSYAKVLIDRYIKEDNNYDLTPPNIDGVRKEDTFAEALIYMCTEKSYRFFLLNENPYYQVHSSIRTDYDLFFESEKFPLTTVTTLFIKKVIKWWQEIGSKKTIDELLPFNQLSKGTTFDWGNLHPNFVRIITDEIFRDRVYEKHQSVKQGDIVLDVGANCGAFTYSIMAMNPKHVYCFEPSDTLIQNLERNTRGCPVTIINKGIGEVDDDSKQIEQSNLIYGHVGQVFKSITFKKFIDDYKLSKIDFLKFDCEGGEYFIFTEENEDYIKNNVVYAAGEWHFMTKDSSHFIDFRDRYLLPSKFFRVYDRWDNDLTNSILDDSFVNDMHERLGGNDYGQVMVYVSWK